MAIIKITDFLLEQKPELIKLLKENFDEFNLKCYIPWKDVTIFEINRNDLPTDDTEIRLWFERNNKNEVKIKKWEKVED